MSIMSENENTRTSNNKATWIWYPGDFEIWLRRQVEVRREERGAIVPPPWRLDSCFNSVRFLKDVELEKPEEIRIRADGRFNFYLDTQIVQMPGDTVTIPAGRHQLWVSVYNDRDLPSVFIEGETIFSNETWQVTCLNNRLVSPGSWDFGDIDIPPTAFKLAVEKKEASEFDQLSEHSILVDFGKQTFGYLSLEGVTGTGAIDIYYGESKEEALSPETCETLDMLQVNEGETDYILDKSRAFRYVQVITEKGLSISNITMFYEYLPLNYRGHFRCSDERINQIWDVSAYTLHLNTREFFLDGVKRDRWVWSGDAYQSYLMNYYLFFDQNVTKRTQVALRGKDPLEIHLNTILDYSFYWLMGMYDYYLYTGDITFIEQNFEKMLSLMDFCQTRLNENGMIEGLDIDWVFVDWADISKQGELSFEQILYCRSLEVMAYFCTKFGQSVLACAYYNEAETMKRKIQDVFWDEEKGGLRHARVNGELKEEMTKHANMFALMLDVLTPDQKDTVKHQVLLNDQTMPIRTPYMRFYELGALCEIDQHEHVLNEIRDYWGGMLDLGATSFWEEYNPQDQGAEHYAMYNRPFGKSLCHAWGASPLYLLGKYFLGVKPLEPGYEKYEVTPHLGNLDWIEGTVPAGKSKVNIFMDKKQIQVVAAKHGIGYIKFKSEIQPETDNGTIKHLGGAKYEIELQPGTTVHVKYKAT